MQNGVQPKVSVIGASGYGGIELVRLLSRHPGVTLGALIAGSSAGSPLSGLTLQHKPPFDATFEKYSPDAVADSDLVFLALPSGEALSILPELDAAGKKVIDLGGDFRLNDTGEYQKYYKREHTASHLLNKSVYGLSELNRKAIASASIVANPGCYATSIILPLVPLVGRGLIGGKSVTITSLSGVSGAGKKAALEYSFTELNDSIKAYRIGSHQHTPEIHQALRDFGGSDISFSFVPHLVPITRGIHTTITAPLSENISIADVTDAYQNYYSSEPFVALSPEAAPALRRVQNTNMIEIGWAYDADTNSVVVLSTIDNLLKGAAGQALQNMNIMLGFDETTGL